MNVSKSLFVADAIRKLDAIHPNDARGSVVDSDHAVADQILVDLLRDIGMANVADAYDRCRHRVGF